MAKLVYIDAPETTFTEVIGTAETYYFSLKPNFKADGTFYVSDILEVEGNAKNKK